MHKVRTTLVLEDIVIAKMKQLAHGNISKLANEILKKGLFQKKKSISGHLRGKGLVKAWAQMHREEEDAHGNLYR